MGAELPLCVVVIILECHVFWSQVESKIVCFIFISIRYDSFVEVDFSDDVIYSSYKGC